MDGIRLKARAKLNLNLNVLPRKGERGYYGVRFLNAEAALADTVKLERLPGRGFSIDDAAFDGDENIALRAARLVFESLTLPGGLRISIEKTIPSRAGLGGGSSDAAAVLNGLDRLFGLSLSVEKRIGMAKGLGMDVCYCVVGGLCEIGGIGEIVRPLDYRLPGFRILIATPPVRKPSTAWAYSLLDPSEIGLALPKFDDLVEGIASEDAGKIARSLHNDFEAPVQKVFPVTRELKERMLEGGAVNAMLAGSGLSVFGLFEGVKDLKTLARDLERRGVACRVTAFD